MNDSGGGRPLTGWQRAHVLSAAQYLREVLVKTPDNYRARVVFEGLLEVLEPTRRILRQHREQHGTSANSMWEQRSGHERRLSDRRKVDLRPPSVRERRSGQRRSGRDRRKT